LRNCPPDAAGTAGHHRQLAIQAERVGKTSQKMPPSITRVLLRTQKPTWTALFECVRA
jgi:hypothetical protein